MGAEQRKALIEEIQVKRGDSRLICYVTSDRPNATAILAKDVVPLFYNHLMQWEKSRNWIFSSSPPGVIR